MLIWFLLVLGLKAEEVLASEYPICPSIIFSEKPSFQLSSDEVGLVCGDPKGKDFSSQAWSEISPSQAELSLKAMFQVRGFHKAIFQIRDGVLLVKLGKETRRQSVAPH